MNLLFKFYKSEIYDRLICVSDSYSSEMYFVSDGSSEVAVDPSYNTGFL